MVPRNHQRIYYADFTPFSLFTALLACRPTKRFRCLNLAIKVAHTEILHVDMDKNWNNA